MSTAHANTHSPLMFRKFSTVISSVSESHHEVLVHVFSRSLAATPVRQMWVFPATVGGHLLLNGRRVAVRLPFSTFDGFPGSGPTRIFVHEFLPPRVFRESSQLTEFSKLTQGHVSPLGPRVCTVSRRLPALMESVSDETVAPMAFISLIQ